MQSFEQHIQLVHPSLAAVLLDNDYEWQQKLAGPDGELFYAADQWLGSEIVHCLDESLPRVKNFLHLSTNFGHVVHMRSSGRQMLAAMH